MQPKPHQSRIDYVMASLLSTLDRLKNATPDELAAIRAKADDQLAFEARRKAKTKTPAA